MTTKAKHTPGPWHKGTGNGEGFVFANHDGRTRLESGGTTRYSICQVSNGFEASEDAANANVLAAAAELYDACKELLEICRWKCSPTDEVILASGKTNHDAMIEASARRLAVPKAKRLQRSLTQSRAPWSAFNRCRIVVESFYF